MIPERHAVSWLLWYCIALLYSTLLYSTVQSVQYSALVACVVCVAMLVRSCLTPRYPPLPLSMTGVSRGRERREHRQHARTQTTAGDKSTIEYSVHNTTLYLAAYGTVGGGVRVFLAAGSALPVVHHTAMCIIWSCNIGKQTLHFSFVCKPSAAQARDIPRRPSCANDCTE